MVQPPAPGGPTGHTWKQNEPSEQLPAQLSNLEDHDTIDRGAVWLWRRVAPACIKCWPRSTSRNTGGCPFDSSLPQRFNSQKLGRSRQCPSCFVLFYMGLCGGALCAGICQRAACYCAESAQIPGHFYIITRRLDSECNGPSRGTGLAGNSSFSSRERARSDKVLLSWKMTGQYWAHGNNLHKTYSTIYIYISPFPCPP